MKSPRRQGSHVWSAPPNQPTPTRWPGVHCVTPSPTASTTLAPRVRAPVGRSRRALPRSWHRCDRRRRRRPARGHAPAGVRGGHVRPTRSRPPAMAPVLPAQGRPARCRNRGIARSLERSEALHRLLAEPSTDLISRHTADGRFRYVWPASSDLLGIAPGDLMGRTAQDLVHPDDVAVLATPDAGLHAPERPEVTVRLRHRDGYPRGWHTRINTPTFPRPVLRRRPRPGVPQPVVNAAEAIEETGSGGGSAWARPRTAGTSPSRSATPAPASRTTYCR